MSQGALACPQQLISDRFAIRGAVTTIRNAFTRARDREPLHPSPDERRTSTRIILQVPVTVTPAIVDDRGVWVPQENEAAIPARSRDISLSGVGFAHAPPLVNRYAVVRFSLAAAEPICLVIELAWSCRQTDGLHVSGSRILGLIDPT